MSFRAMFDGTCANDCGNRIHPGDNVEYVDGELMHVECVPALSKYDMHPGETVCGDCWMVYTVGTGHEC